jgi:hypothetical protein
MIVTSVHELDCLNRNMISTLGDNCNTKQVHIFKTSMHLLMEAQRGCATENGNKKMIVICELRAAH